MGTWCTEGVKRSRAEHRREEDERERRIYYKKKVEHERKCEAKNICPECGQKIIKEKKSRHVVRVSLPDKDKQLEQLKAELAKHRWIPVSERLPVLIDDNGYKYSSKVEIIYNGMIIEATFSEHHNQWFADYGGTTIVMSASLVTHWKPIILPKEAGKSNCLNLDDITELYHSGECPKSKLCIKKEGE